MKRTTLLFLISVLSLASAQDHLKFLEVGDMSQNEKKELAIGFKEGMLAFDNLPFDNNCKQGDQVEIIEDVVDIVMKLKDLKSDFAGALGSLVKRGKGILSKVKSSSGPCRNVSAEVKRILTRMLKHMKSVKYLMELPMHVYNNLNDIKNRNKLAKQTLDEKDYHNAGRLYGNMVFTIFLWKFDY
jgi:hypothetical protein